MEPDDSVEAYRQRLLASLHVVPGRRHLEEPGSLQIFVNHECVGTVDCDEASHAVASITQPRPIQMVEIRTAAGLLIGSLCAQDLRMKMARLPVGTQVLEISIHNRIDGGSVQVAYQAAKPLLNQAGVMAKAEPAKQSPSSNWSPRRWSFPSLWTNVAMVGQAGLAIAVLFLVADRLADRGGAPLRPQVESPETRSDESSIHRDSVSVTMLERQQEVLLRVMKGQQDTTRTMQAQQRALERAHHAIEGLTRSHSQLTTRMSRVSLQMAQLDEDARAGLEVRTKVERAAKPATVTLAQAMPADLGAAIPAKAVELTTLSPGPFPGIVEGTRDLAPLAPFSFWVSFQENTTEKSIQDLLQEIRGRPGQIKAGWYNVEVDLPQPQTPDLFIDALKQMKIVKSVTMNLQTTSAR